jgi:N-methylhydantoinase A
MGFRISVDTGGTFTDVVVADAKGIRAIGKALTTPKRIFEGMRAAIEVAAEGCGITGDTLLQQTDMLIYGTTRATNAVVTKATAKTAFLTTRGFRDILVLKEGGKYDPHDYSYDYPQPYIPRRYTFEVDERIDAQGNVVRAFDEQQAREKALARLLDEELPGVPYTLSHELIPIVREYRRASTTAIDASLKPLMQQHLREMESDLRAAGFRGELLIGTSAGGCQHVSEVAGRPVQMLKSGPAMAPVAGQAYVTIESLGGDAIVCDTGGTTFDVGLVRDANLVYTRDSWLGRRWLGDMVAMSTVDVRSIGAGGGSIGWIDAGGLLRVGPQSAGAVPGPACYGRGGEFPTVTDASVVLGYFDPDYFNGGRMTLDVAAAHRVIEKLAGELGRSVPATAFAMITIANELMIKAIHEITVSEGLNPRESVIVAGGGAAGLNIMPIARELGCSTTILPKTASAMSACGMQYSDIVFEQTRSRVTMSGSFDAHGVNTALDEIDEALERFRKDLRGAERAQFRKEYFAEARYKSQVWELDTPLPVKRFRSPKDVATLVEAFHTVHDRVYAVRDEQSEVECVNWRGKISIRLSKPAKPVVKRLGRRKPKPWMTRAAWFGPDDQRKTNVYRGTELKPGDFITGPAIIEEPTTTIVVYPRMSAFVSPSGHYILKS